MGERGVFWGGGGAPLPSERQGGSAMSGISRSRGAGPSGLRTADVASGPQVVPGEEVVLSIERPRNLERPVPGTNVAGTNVALERGHWSQGLQSPIHPRERQTGASVTKWPKVGPLDIGDDYYAQCRNELFRR